MLLRKTSQSPDLLISWPILKNSSTTAIWEIVILIYMYHCMYHCVSRVTFRPPSAVWATEMRMNRHRMQTSSSAAHTAKHLTELECLSESLKSLSTITSDNDLIMAFCCWMGINPCSQEPKNHPQNNWSRYSSTLMSVRLDGTCSTITFGCGVHVSKYFWPAFFFFSVVFYLKREKKIPLK